MKTQAKRCTRKELAYLSHWRLNGYMLTIDEPIPLSALTAPTKDEPRASWLLGIVVIIAALTLFGAWFGKAAGIY
jgi:hypothetical protein